MSYKVDMNYELSKADEAGFRLGKAQTTIETTNESQDFETLFRIKGEFRDNVLEWALEIVGDHLSRLENITIHPTLIMQLTLIVANAQLVFHRDNPKAKPEFKFHTVGFHYNMLMDSFAKLTKSEPDSMKQARQFKGAVLKGLWYKHVDDASISGMATNILNEMKKDDWVMKSFTDHFGPFDGTKKFNDKHARFLAHQFTVVSQQKRSGRKEMTGEWIVYQKNDEDLHLLTLASHQEDDARILRRIKP